MKKILTLLFLIAALALPISSGQAQATGEPLVVTADSAAKAGLPGSVVTYTLTLTNKNATDDVITISAKSGDLVTVNAPAGVTVPAGQSVTIPVAVNIAAAALPGGSDGTTVSFAGSVSATTSILLTTTVNTPPPTAVPTNTATPVPTVSTAGLRPLVVINGYYLDQDTIKVGDTFTLFITLKNNGKSNATNLVLSMVNENFLPQETGGVVALGSLDADGNRDVTQKFLVNTSLYGQGVGIVPVKLSYTDSSGTAFTESFSITLQLKVYSGQAAATATPTQSIVSRPQLVVNSYKASVDPLQPGAQFSLDLEVVNMGNSNARSATMVIGGGTIPDVNGTPQPGGTSGGSSDLSVFAPVGSSNLVFLGDLDSGAKTSLSSNLIVNVSANPGAYTLKLSFIYNDTKGIRQVDDQIITLLIYQLPMVEVNFYRDPGMIFAGQPVVLPLQVVNMGRKSVVLGNMKVSVANADVQNGTSLVGALDAGGSFTLDTTFTPQQAGEGAVLVDISYTDDFNQPRHLNQVVKVTIQEAPTGPEITPGSGVLGPDGKPIDVTNGGSIPVPETPWDQVLRAVKGLLGLDSAPPTITVPSGGKDGNKVPQTEQSVPVQSVPLKGP
jgi:uncharacterized repeat protein (TIGR01451 family)